MVRKRDWERRMGKGGTRRLWKWMNSSLIGRELMSIGCCSLLYMYVIV